MWGTQIYGENFMLKKQLDVYKQRKAFQDEFIVKSSA